jgi:hypothetical protein
MNDRTFANGPDAHALGGAAEHNSNARVMYTPICVFSRLTVAS